MNIPMLDEEEFELCNQASKKGRTLVEAEIAKRKIVGYPWLEDIDGPYEKLRYFIDMYRVITGFPETNPNAIFHHRLSTLGPDCPNCGNPLRTSLAKYCANCGFGKEDITTDSRPLVKKRPDLFQPS